MALQPVIDIVVPAIQSGFDLLGQGIQSAIDFITPIVIPAITGLGTFFKEAFLGSLLVMGSVLETGIAGARTGANLRMLSPSSTPFNRKAGAAKVPFATVTGCRLAPSGDEDRRRILEEFLDALDHCRRIVTIDETVVER